MSIGFIKITRDAQELFENDIDAFIVLMQMAFRARWKDSQYNKDGLELGEALIGKEDSIRLKLNEQRYRDAKKRIEQKYKKATFKGTNKGTIGKFTDNSVCDLNIQKENEQKNEQKNDQRTSGRTIKERAKNEQAPPNEERKKERTVSVSKETSTASAISSPSSPDFSIDRKVVEEALSAKGIKKPEDQRQILKSYGAQKVWLGLQHIFSQGFEIETTPIKALNWACKIEAWKFQSVKKETPREIIEAYFSDGKNYNGYICGMDSKGIWFYSGPNYSPGVSYECKTFSATFANLCEKLGIENPLKKTINIKEA